MKEPVVSAAFLVEKILWEVTKMNPPKIQVVIPVYNAEKTLRDCLDSLKNQTYTDWQALIVDDASGDGSYDIIREYENGDERFRCFRKNENGGASAARNFALSQLSADYTAFLDSDDYWDASMLEHLMAQTEQTNCDVCQCRYIYDFPGGKSVLPKGAFPESVVLSGKGLRRVYRRMMTGINMNHVCMKLIRTELIKDLRFDPTLKTGEDLKFCIQLFGRVKTYAFIDEVLYHYRRVESSLTNKGLSGKEKLSANRRIARDMVAALPSWGIDTVFYRTLSYIRPYIITVSKIFRMLREKLLSGKA